MGAKRFTVCEEVEILSGIVCVNVEVTAVATDLGLAGDLSD